MAIENAKPNKAVQMTDKVQIGIYKIKREITELSKKQKPTDITVDVNYLKTLFRKKGYKPQVVQDDLSSDFNVYLFFKRRKSKIRWKEFIGSIAEDNEDILTRKETINESFILLMENKTLLFSLHICNNI